MSDRPAACRWFPRGLLALLCACSEGERTAAPAGEGLRVVSAAELAAEMLLSSVERPVLLNLWATWCPPCLAELPAFAEVAAAEPGVSFWGASADWTLHSGERPIAEDAARVAQRWHSLALDFPSVYLSDAFLEDIVAALDLPDGVLPQTLLYRDGRRVAQRSAALDAEELRALVREALTK